MSRRSRSADFLASAPTFGQRLDQVLVDACARLGARSVEPVVYTQPVGPPAALARAVPGLPVLGSLAGVVVVAVRAVSRVAVYWDWRYAYTYAPPVDPDRGGSPFSLDEELLLHALPPAATVMHRFADQVVDLAAPAA